MSTTVFLAEHRVSILEEATAAVSAAGGRHYEATGADEVRWRLEALFDLVAGAAETRKLTDLLAYARELAAARFRAGYDLGETQSALNALEAATWRCALAHVPPERLPETLGVVGTVLGAAKDALAREYVSLAARTHVPSLDLRELFAGA